MSRKLVSFSGTPYHHATVRALLQVPVKTQLLSLRTLAGFAFFMLLHVRVSSQPMYDTTAPGGCAANSLTPFAWDPLTPISRTACP